MISGFRFLIVALGLTLVSPSYGQGTKHDQSQVSHKPSVQLERIASAVEKLPLAQAPDRGCEPGLDDRQSDLCAQWKAADAATESAEWTFWSFITATIGLIIGGGTLFAAWRAAHWAKKAAEETKRTADLAEASVKDTEIALESAAKSAIAAERQALISEDTAKRQLRAYVTVDQPYINNAPYVGAVLEYRIVATNNGVTPAKSLEWMSKFTLAFDEEAESELILLWEDAERSSAIVGAGKSVNMHGRLPSPVTAEYMQRLEKGTAHIWVVGEIRYQDIFGETHSSKYRGYYDLLRGVVWDRLGNDAT